MQFLFQKFASGFWVDFRDPSLSALCVRKRQNGQILQNAFLHAEIEAGKATVYIQWRDGPYIHPVTKAWMGAACTKKTFAFDSLVTAKECAKWIKAHRAEILEFFKTASLPDWVA